MDPRDAGATVAILPVRVINLSKPDNQLRGKEGGAETEQDAIEPTRTDREFFAKAFKKSEANYERDAEEFMNDLRPEDHRKVFSQRHAADEFEEEVAIAEHQ